MRLSHAVGIGALVGAVTAGSVLWPGARPVLAPSPMVPTSGTACGVERWPVKTMTDRHAGEIRLTPVPITIKQLTARIPPKRLPAARMAPTETTVFQITAQVVGFKLEADNDIHVVLSDGELTMIAEFPDVDRCAATSFQAASMRAARAAFIAAYGEPTPMFQQTEGQATLTGVGFFDVVHGQKGASINGIELHPVLGFSQ